MATIEKKTPTHLLGGITKNASVILFLVLWETGCKTGFLKETFVAAPSTVIAAAGQLLQDGSLFHHIFISLQRSVLGFVFAIVMGIPLGILLGGGFKTFERIVNPVLHFLGQCNPFSLFPVFILFFGIGEASKVIMIFWVSLWPILFNTITGVKEVDPLLVKSSKSMGAGKATLFSKVVFPSALPFIFTGIKMSSGTAFFMLIAAEMLGSSSGLGWLVWNAQVNYQIPLLYAATMVISILGLTIHGIFKQVEKRVVTWKDATPH